MSIPDRKLSVNDHDDFDQISLDTQEETLNYTIIPNALLRDASISPQCRWLIAFLLSNKQGWTIKSKQLVNHVKGFMGRDRVFKMLNEAIEAGYIERTIIVRKNLKGYSYRVASTPKFKKILRCPEFQDTESQYPECQDPENTHTKEITSKELTSSNTNTPPLPEKQPAGFPAISQPPLAESASADGGVCDNSSKQSKRKAPEVSAKVRDIANKMVALLTKYNPVYRLPPDLDKFLYQVQQMVEKEQQDPAVILRTFEWAVSDNEQRGEFKGWQSVIVTNKKGGKITNPAQNFREAFSKIHSQMSSRPKRKFAASSNHEDAVACMTDMESRAL